MERRRVTRETDTDFNLSVDNSSGEPEDTLLNNLTPERVFPQQSNLQGDRLNIAILLFLYVLQGIPLGLAGSIPMILQNRNVSYKQQAEFSFVHWPFSIKLLWAPIVDAVFLRRFGRRKTWLIPTQYLIGLFLIILSSSVNSLLGSSTEAPNVFLLTVMFFSINSLAATQDIAVDGWALTMLSRRNVGYASTCNSVGQTAGFFLGNVVFLALESASFCNSYLRSEPQLEGIVTLAGFMKFWGIIFFITTTLIMIFKSEREEQTQVSDIRDSYIKLFRIICLHSVQLIIGFLVTCKIAFAVDTVTGLKLIEAGVKKEHLALLAVPIVPLQIMLPLLISKYTSGPRPLSVFMKAYPFRMLLGLLFSVLVWWTHKVKSEDGSFPIYYYIVITLAYALHQITVYCIFVALMSFFAQVSDPSIGGTYMTLLNTICNIGSNWPSTLALWWVDPLTSRYCEGSSLHSCDTKELSLKCTEAGHTCAIGVDGYYIETVICIIFGFAWLRWGRSAVQRLQHLPLTAWKTNR